MVTPRLAAALMLPEVALMASGDEVVGVARSGATVTSTWTLTAVASVMLTVAGVNFAETPAGGASRASVTPPVRPPDGVSVS